MAGFVAFVVFWAAVALYGIYVFRRILGRGQLSRVDWPRGWRLVAYVSGLVVTVVVIFPAAIMAAGYVLGMGNCTAAHSADQPWRCSPPGRVFVLALFLFFGLPLAAAWLRLLLGFVLPRCQAMTTNNRWRGP